MTTITLIKGDRVGRNTDYRDALPVNMFAIKKQFLGASGYMLQFQGLTKLADGVGIDRGGYWNDIQQDHFRVSGEQLVSVGAGGSVTQLGEISGTDTASLTHSFQSQGVVADGRFWRYVEGSGLSEVTDSDLGNPIDVIYVDGYYFFTDGEFLYHTDIGDETSIDPLKFSTAAFQPDKTYGLLLTEDNKVVVIGRYTIEYFVNDASEDFAFTRVPSRAQKIGMIGTHCKAESAGKFYIIGGRKEEAVSIHAVSVGQSVSIATREIDKILGEYEEEDLRDSVLETYQEDGYKFLVVHLPDHTLLYNETIGDPQFAWSVLKTDILGTDPWRAIHGVFDPRIGWVFGDRLNGNIGLLDASEATHYGQIAQWELYTPFLKLEAQSVDEFEVETIPGFNGSNDASVFISTTYNGVVWSQEWAELYGIKGDYDKRFIIRRLGYVDDWVGFRLRGATRSRMAFATASIQHG